MSSKVKLQHQLETGVIATRTTARDYTHVLIVDGHRVDYLTEDEIRHEVYETHNQYRSYIEQLEAEGKADEAKAAREGAETTIKNRIARQKTSPGVLSWHGSEALAVKAQASAVNSGYRNPRVEAINGGAR